MAAFSINTELWGEMYIGIMRMGMGMRDCSTLNAVDLQVAKIGKCLRDPGTFQHFIPFRNRIIWHELNLSLTMSKLFHTY